MMPKFISMVACGLCGAVLLADLFPLHHCTPDACGHPAHTHAEIPVGGRQIPTVLGGINADVSTTSSAVFGSMMPNSGTAGRG